MVILSPWAAVLADRVCSRTVLIGTQFISAFIAISMAWRYVDESLGVHTLLADQLAKAIHTLEIHAA